MHLIPSAKRILPILLAIALQPAPAAAQSRTHENSAQSQTIWITARNREGGTAELSSSDVEIKIDGKQVSISNLRRVTPALNYCLLLDTSGSTRPSLPIQRDRAAALLSKIPKAGRDYGVLVVFNDETYVDAEGTDPQKLADALKKETNSAGGTALYDAIVACSDDFSKHNLSKGAPDALRLIFIFSDGDDNASHVSRDATERTLISDGVRVYAIPEKGAPNVVTGASQDIKTLERLAEVSGGTCYHPRNKLVPEQIAADVYGDIDGLYAATLTPGTALRENRVYKLEVKCIKSSIAVAAPSRYLVPSKN